MRQHLEVEGCEIEERVALGADRPRHLLQVDQVEAEARIGAQQRDDVAPNHYETLRAHAVGEILRQQRRVVVAQRRGEPGKSVRERQGEPVPLDRERQDEEDLPVAVAAEHDGGDGAVARTDALLPGGEPIEGLEDGAVGMLLERFPLLLHFAQVAMDFEVDAGARARPCGRRRADAQRRAHRQRKLLLVVRDPCRAWLRSGHSGRAAIVTRPARAETGIARGHQELVVARVAPSRACLRLFPKQIVPVAVRVNHS